MREFLQEITELTESFLRFLRSLLLRIHPHCNRFNSSCHEKIFVATGGLR